MPGQSRSFATRAIYCLAGRVTRPFPDGTVKMIPYPSGWHKRKTNDHGYRKKRCAGCLKPQCGRRTAPVRSDSVAGYDTCLAHLATRGVSHLATRTSRTLRQAPVAPCDSCASHLASLSCRKVRFRPPADVSFWHYSGGAAC